jgi:hypothetical protein
MHSFRISAAVRYPVAIALFATVTEGTVSKTPDESFSLTTIRYFLPFAFVSKSSFDNRGEIFCRQTSGTPTSRQAAVPIRANKHSCFARAVSNIQCVVYHFGITRNAKGEIVFVQNFFLRALVRVESCYLFSRTVTRLIQKRRAGWHRVPPQPWNGDAKRDSNCLFAGLFSPDTDGFIDR